MKAKPLKPAVLKKSAAKDAPLGYPHFDPLTQVLEGVRLKCMAPSAHEMTAPWGVRFRAKAPAEIRKHVASLGLTLPTHDLPTMRGALIAVLRGSCWLEVEEHRDTLALAGGDVVMLNRHDTFTLRDDPQTAVRDIHDLVRREDIVNLRGVRYGGGGVLTTFLCGHFFFEDDEDSPLLSALPPIIHIRPSDSDSVPWLEGTLRLMSQELATRRAGSQSVVNHLAHVLFVQAVRAHAASLPEDGTANWFHAIIDSELAPALGLMHLQPEQPWTVARLAEASYASRSAFAARFTAAVGQPPLQYLTECRMRNARVMLRQTKLGVKVISTKVGYANEAAFSNAFKRLNGVSPGRYRELKSP